jgi:hypothetical protein
MGVRASVGVGWGPFRVSASTNGRRKRKAATPYWTHEGCISHHGSVDSLERCAAKKAAKAAARKAAAGPQDAVPPGYR